jgi:hexokinase
VLPFTEYDAELDKLTENPRKQLFEKMLSGLYLGEIARLILTDFIHDGELFNGKEYPRLNLPHAFETQFMSRVERDHSQDLYDTQALLEDIFDVKDSTLQDRRIVKRVCELVGIRAARLSAAAVAGVVMKMNRLNGCTVAIDGSVFEHYPHFKNRMMDALRELFGMSADSIKLELARDGSGVGAALIAMVMGQEHEEKKAKQRTQGEH